MSTTTTNMSLVKSQISDVLLTWLTTNLNANMDTTDAHRHNGSTTGLTVLALNLLTALANAGDVRVNGTAFTYRGSDGNHTLLALDLAATLTALLTSTGGIDLSGASVTTGLKAPSSAGAAPTAAGAVAFDSTAAGLVFGDGTNTVALSGQKRIGDTTLSVAATNITFSSIPGTYKHLRLEVQSRGDGAVTNEAVALQFNGDTGANYDYERNRASNATNSASNSVGQTFAQVGTQPGTSVTRAAVFGATTVTIPNYAGTTAEKSFRGDGGFIDSTAANSFADLLVCSWRNTAAITSIKLFPSSSTNFAAGTRATLYAWN